MTGVRIDAVIFDIDDTLVDDNSSWWHAVRATCQSLRDRALLSERVSPEELASSYKRVSDTFWSRYTDVLAPLGSMVEIRRHVWAHALAAHGLQLSDMLLDSLVEDYAARRVAEVRVDPELVGLLGRLAQRYRLGVCSNGHGTEQAGKLRRAGLATFFEAVVCGQEHAVFKPDPRLFHRCCESLGVAPSRCLHIGDHWHKDVLGAWHAGLHPIWIGGSPPVPDSPVTRFPTTALAIRALLNGDGPPPLSVPPQGRP